MNNTGVPEQEVPVMEDYHEVFLGYESGAIGMIRISLAVNSPEPKVESLILILPRKIISELGAKHILSLHSIETRDENHPDPLNEFRLAIGQYSKSLQVLYFIESSGGDDNYVVLDQKQTEAGFLEKPGIGCLHSVAINKKHLLAQGGFDFRIRVFSALSLKLLVTLKFHTGIVNRIFVEEQQAKANPFSDATSSQLVKRINLYSVAEDGNLACWNLDV